MGTGTDAYGRRRGAPLRTAATALAAVGMMLVGGLGNRNSRPGLVLGVALFSVALLTSLFSAGWMLPRPCAEDHGDMSVLRLPRWRRLALVLPWGVLALGSLLLAALSPPKDPGDDSRTIWLVLAAAFTMLVAFMAWIYSQTIRFTADWIEMASGPGKGIRFRCEDIARVTVSETWISLRPRSGKQIGLRTRLFDGYPELAAWILARLPDGALTAQGRGLLQRQAAIATAHPQAQQLPRALDRL